MQIEKSELDKQIDKLLERERTCRTLNDHLGSTAVLKEITTLCYKTGDIDKTCEVVINLMKKRGQAKKAQIQLVQMIMGWLPEIKDHDKKMKVVETIREVCDKKIFLQVEYARAVLMIVQNKEDANNINDAAKILQEVQVQTYGSMSRREKLEFILYQMKIMIKRGDYVRLFIISKKINEANLNDDELIDLKVRFYAYMCIYYNHENKYGDTARCYKTIWKALKDTKVEDNPCTTDFDFSIRYSDVLANYVGFLVLEPFSQSQKSQLEELFKSEQIESTPHVYHMVSTFLSREIVSCEPSTYNLQRYTLFDKAYENSEKHLHSFRKMLIQHNIRTMAEYYERLKLPRMAQLTSVPVQDVEQQLCDLMNNKLVTCHIDRLEQTVDFKPPQNENTVLSKWNESINSILELIDKASNLIERENEIHLIKA